MARRTTAPIGPTELEELHARITAGDVDQPWVVHCHGSRIQAVVQ